ncbi:MAG: hypothetical protein GF353_05770 [Candidatus Lokiarchaeota archaeon]|nr:hypothetical protein [Candidatus Lokiarchaeota archaeon]
MNVLNIINSLRNVNKIMASYNNFTIEATPAKSTTFRLHQNYPYAFSKSGKQGTAITHIRFELRINFRYYNDIFSLAMFLSLIFCFVRLVANKIPRPTNLITLFVLNKVIRLY